MRAQRHGPPTRHRRDRLTTLIRSGTAAPSSSRSHSSVVTARADDIADAKAVILTQMDQIKAEDLAGLEAGFTRRLQDRITADLVKKAKGEAGTYTIDDLVASVAPAGKDSLKIKMKNGRTLTTLVKIDGAWLADTIRFN
jgi:hypothetical protein